MELTIDEAIAPISPAVYWDFVAGCGSWNMALERARSLAGAAIPLSQENAQSWRNSVVSFLAPLLHMAAWRGLDQEEMLAFARFDSSNAPDTEGGEGRSFAAVRDYLANKKQDDAYHPAVRECDTLLAATAEVQSNVLYVVRTDVFGIFSYESHVSSEALDMAKFLSGWSTLYITVRPQRAEQCRAMIAGLVDALCSMWQSVPRDRHDGTLLLALDEVANVAPVATLPEIVATGGGSGIQCMLGFQSPSQARRCWGDEGIDTVVRNPTHTVIFPGLSDRGFLDDTAALFGQAVQYEDEVHVAKDAPIRAGTADARRLIKERQRLNEYLGRFPESGRARERAERSIGRILATERRRARFRPMAGSDDQSAAAVLAEIRQLTHVEPKAERRQTLEASDIYRGYPGSMFLKSNDHITKVPRYSFNQAPGWWLDPLWSGMLG